MKHEQSHADHAQKQKRCDTCLLHKSVPEVRKAPNCHECPPFPPRFPPVDAIKSECKAPRHFQLPNQFTKEQPRPVGWDTGDDLIKDYLKKKPGKCSKEFPDDESLRILSIGLCR